MYSVMIVNLLFAHRFIGLSPFFESREIVSLIPHPSFDFPYYDYMLVKLVRRNKA